MKELLTRRELLRDGCLLISSALITTALGCSGTKNLTTPTNESLDLGDDQIQKLARRKKGRSQKDVLPSSGDYSEQSSPLPSLIQIQKITFTNGSLTFHLADGRSVTDIESILSGLDQSVSYYYITAPAVLISVQPGRNTTAKYYHAGKYWWRIQWERGWVHSACFDRYGWHLNIHLKEEGTEREIFNLHLIWWLENGRWCFGIYNSAKSARYPKGWCWSKCGPSWDDLKNAFTSAIQSGANQAGIYLSWATAAALAAGLMLLLFAA